MPVTSRKHTKAPTPSHALWRLKFPPLALHSRSLPQTCLHQLQVQVKDLRLDGLVKECFSEEVLGAPAESLAQPNKFLISIRILSLSALHASFGWVFFLSLFLPFYRKTSFQLCVVESHQFSKPSSSASLPWKPTLIASAGKNGPLSDD